MLDPILVIVQVGTSLALILFILLHAGRGGGLSDMLGGGGPGGGSLAGSTVVEKNLDRLTVITALVWVLSTIAIGLRL